MKIVLCPCRAFLALIVLAAPMLRGAPAIPNPSFETNHFTSSVSPYVSDNGQITGWTVLAGDANYVGLNPSFNGAHDFANNGKTPDGTNVAFLQCRSGHAPTTLSTTITGLTVGVTYQVQFQANARFGGTPSPSYQLNGGSAVTFAVTNVDTNGVFTDPYPTISARFTATATTAALAISNNAPSGDSSLLLDNFTIAVATPSTFTVTNTNNTGPGSLRQAFTDAAALAGPDNIVFDPGLSGSMITLLSEIGVADNDGVTVDASDLPGEVILSGGNACRIFDVMNATSKLTLKNLFITGGSATGTSPVLSARGGAINNEGTLTVMNCSINNSTATESGGAISNPGGILTLTNCTLSDNTAASSGGALVTAGTVTINGCTFYSNSAMNMAGGAITDLATGLLTVSRSTFTNNQAATAGGAISDGGGNSGNGSNAGAQTITLSQCTIAGNISLASGSGGGLSFSGSTVATLSDTILSGNTANGVLHNYGSTGTAPTLTASNHNLSDDTPKGFTGTDIVNSTTIGLSPLANNGGLTQTMAISLSSPALNGAVGSAATTDQRGYPVIGVPDIGAYELQTTVFALSANTYTAVAGYPVTVTITRSQSGVGAATVRLTTSTGTGSFTPRLDVASSDVTFGDGETSKDMVIAITKSTTTANKTFTISLSRPSPATLASVIMPSSATVTIKSPTSLQVTTTNDDGPGSLRQVLAAAGATAAYHVITFAPALNGKTITLGSEIIVNDAVGVTIDATALAAGLTIDGGAGGNRIFTVLNATAANFSLLHLTLTNGHGGSTISNGNASGGAILNFGGNLLLIQCTLTANKVSSFGGAIDNLAVLTLRQCTISNNSAAFGGGGIYNNSGGTATFSQCAFSGNTVTSASGGAVQSLGSLTMTQCTLSGNAAGTYAGGLLVTNGSASLAQCTVSNNKGTGGGGGIVSVPTLLINRCIVAGNLATTGSKDIIASAGVNLLGTNIVEDISLNGSVIGGSGTILNADPGLNALASNGGPTQTMSLVSDSPALDAAAGSTFTTDQRGLPIVGVPDIGAFEVQTGGVFSLNQSSYFVFETGGEVDVLILRGGRFQGPASVTLSTAVGTAGKTDFTGVSKVVNFAAGQDFITVPIAIVNDTLMEASETFTVTLSKPSAGCTLGNPASATVVIIDPSYNTDNTKPGAPTITSPAANAMVGVPTGGTLTLTGTATDNNGVADIGVFASSGGPVTLGTVNTLGATTTTWTAVVTPVTGVNTYEVEVGDIHGNISAGTVRTVTVLRPLVVSIAGYGTVTAGYAPSSYRQVGKPLTITATPGAGYLFGGWSIFSVHTPGQLATTTDALLQPTLTFIDREGLVLRATFVPNPYTTGVAGVFNGGIDPTTNSTAASLSSLGYASFTVQSNGAFTGTLKLDGVSYAVPGAFDAVGTARFGVNRVTTFNIVRKTLPDLFVTLNINTVTSTISGVVSAFDGSAVTAASSITAERCPYATGHLVDPSLLNTGSADALYTSILSPTTNPGFATTDFPQGVGYASVKLTKLGAITVTGMLPDGTALSCATTLSGTQHWRLFASLYGGKGLVAGNAAFAAGNYDLSALSTHWLRPVMDTQYYPGGWAAGILINVGGAKYTVTPGASVLPALNVVGDAELAFNYGGLTSVLDDPLRLNSADVATNSDNDPSYKLTINRQTGVFSGFFTQPNDSKPTFSGVVLTKSQSTISAGFFLTPAPKVKDYTGQSGSVILEAKP